MTTGSVDKFLLFGCGRCDLKASPRCRAIIWGQEAMDYPEELEWAFDHDPALRQAFEDLSPGQQQSYLLHFTRAKQTETRSRRIAKAAPKIFGGKGFNKY